MSPEQVDGSQYLDGRTDIYSLGCVLFEMLVGEPPFRGTTLTAVIANRLHPRPPRRAPSRELVPEAVDAAVRKAMATLPADRFRPRRSSPRRCAPRHGGYRGGRGAGHGPGARRRQVGGRAPVREHEHRPRERVLQRRHHRRHHRPALEGQRAQGDLPHVLDAVQEDDQEDHRDREELGVGAMLEGSVRRAGQRVRIVVHLVEPGRRSTSGATRSTVS